MLAAVIPAAVSKNREPWLAASLSFVFPGLGYFSVGEPARGWAVVLLCLAPIAVAAAEILLPRGRLLIAVAMIALLLLIQIASAVDAHAIARRGNSPEFESERTARPDPWRAVFFSHLIPGLGQLLSRRIPWGIGWLLAWFVAEALPGGKAVSWLVGIAAVAHAWFVTGGARGRAATAAMLIAASAVVPLTVTLLVRATIAQAFRIPSASMRPALVPGDYVFIARPGRHRPARGDIVSFRFSQDRRLQFMKRVIAMPGETIEVRGGRTWIDGRPLEEPYATFPAPGEIDRGPFPPTRVPEGHYFVMGDARDDSNDSRHFGPIPASDLTGRAYKIYWPLGRAGPIERLPAAGGSPTL